MKIPIEPEKMVGSSLCYAWAVAALLELPMSEMPTVTPDKPAEFHAAWDRWYRERGLVAYRFDRNMRPSGLYLGFSWHEGEGHVVIMRDGEVALDPLNQLPPKPDDPWFVYFTQRPFPLDQVEVIAPTDPAVLIHRPTN